MLIPLIAEIRGALDSGQWVLALTGALTIPDICAALRAENGRTTEKKYRAWFTDWVTPQYPTLAADDCYQLRCGVLHQGRGTTGNYDALLFVPPTSTFRSRASTIDGRLVIDIGYFVTDVLDAAQRWMEECADDEVVSRNRESLLQWRPEGLAPFIVGMPVLA